MNLTYFENPEITFLARDNGDYTFSLEYGDDIIVDVEPATDFELIEWAEQEDLLNPEEGYVNENSSINYDALRKVKYERDLELFHESPPSFATPCGRAFLWFNSLEIEIPKTLGVWLMDGYHPGNDSQGVVVDSANELYQLQAFLLENDLRVNFEITQ